MSKNWASVLINYWKCLNDMDCRVHVRNTDFVSYVLYVCCTGIPYCLVAQLFFKGEFYTVLDLLCNEIIFILAEAEERKRRRKSRWQGDEKDKTFIPGMPTVLPSNMSKDQEEAYLRKSP